MEGQSCSAVELVDPSEMLPLLQRMQGKHMWHIKDTNGT